MTDSSATKSSLFAKARSWLATIFLLFVLYVLGYFALMDKSRPETDGAFKNYQSSFRWARPMPSKDGRPTKFPDTTVWNVIYEPMDKLFFRFFPRSPEEKQRLINYGYSNSDLQ